MKILLQQKNFLFLLLFLLLSNILLAQTAKNDFPSIALEIPEKSMKKLKEKRKLALYQQALGATGADWVPAKVKFDGKKHDALVRLKGDMMDHWNDDEYWSFKVKINSNATFQGMKRFSLQHPQRRAYMGEWFYHQLFEHLDSSIVTIKYDFVNVSVNDEDFPLYVVEENMDTKVIEHNEQRAGIILKFDSEDMMFVYGNPAYNKIFLGVNPIAYLESKIFPSKTLSNQYYTARNLFEAFRLGNLATHEVFDIKKLATLFAVSDFMGHNHSTALHNVKFYYNPVTSLLEPIPYDNSKIVKTTSLIGKTAVTHIDAKMISWLPTIFNDDLFLEAYMKQLIHLSKKETLDAFFESVKEKSDYRLGLLRKTYPSYTAEKRLAIYRNQERVDMALKSIKKANFEIEIDKKAKDAGNISARIKNKYLLPLTIKNIQIGDNVLKLNGKKTVQASSEQKLYAACSFKIAKGELANIDWSETATVNFILPSTRKELTEDIDFQDIINEEKTTYQHLAFIDGIVKKDKRPLTSLFDIKSIAQQIALYDCLGYRKNAMLQDIKLAYNSKSKQIELGDANYNIANVKPLGKKNVLYGANYTLSMVFKDTPTSHQNFLDKLFLEPTFVEFYVETLANIGKQSLESLDKLNTENSDISADMAKWIKFIKQDSKLQKNLVYNKDMINHILNPFYAATAYFEKYNSSNRSFDIGVSNVFTLPIEVISVSVNDYIHFLPTTNETAVFPVNSFKGNNYQVFNFATNHIIQNQQGKLEKNKNRLPWTNVLQKTMRLNYKIIGSDKSYSAEIKPFEKYDKNFMRKDIMRRKANLDNIDFVSVDEDSQTITIEKGNFTLEKNMIVPANYEFIIEAGTTINLKQNAKIISRSPITWKGTEKSPITIKSSDASGQGVFVMADQEESVMEYVVFDKLSTPKHFGWELTGAVCFYESPVTIEHCTFKNNKSEDALNIFRSKFTLNNSHFENTSSDALDVDFSVGTISNSTFTDCANDAVDVSGRFITLNNLTIDKVGDKAISLGENGKMVGENIVIKDSDIALVVKDLSSADFNNISVSNVKVGVAIYCKKTQFGPGSATLNGFKTKNVEERYLLETNSTLAIDKKNISPNHDDVRSIFYGSVYGKASVR